MIGNLVVNYSRYIYRRNVIFSFTHFQICYPHLDPLLVVYENIAIAIAGLQPSPRETVDKVRGCLVGETNKRSQSEIVLVFRKGAIFVRFQASGGKREASA